MPNSSDFDYYVYQEVREDKSAASAGRLFRQVIALLMVAVLVIGTGYGAFQFMMDTFWGPDNFSAIITNVAAPQINNNCDGVQRVNPVGVIEPTRIMCVCGQLLTDEADGEVNYYLSIKNANDKVIFREKFKDQIAGEFCQRIQLDKNLGEGRYVLEVSAAKRSEATAWYRFSVRTQDRQV